MKILLESIDKTGEFKKSPAYQDYLGLLEEIDKNKTGGDGYDEKFFANAEMYIRYGNFRKLGKGSSRTAYSFDADPRYVLKFAHNDNGLKQNQTELKNANAGDYSCLVRVLEYDPDGVIIVEDSCRQSTYEDWDRILGISPNMLSKIVKTVFETKKGDKTYTLRTLLDEIRDPERAAEILKKTSPMDDEFTDRDYPGILECVENLVEASAGHPAAEKWSSLYDMFRFYFDNGVGAMIPEELLYTDQWGVKSGKTPDDDSLVIIDPGVDTDFMPFAGKNGRIR